MPWRTTPPPPRPELGHTGTFLVLLAIAGGLWYARYAAWATLLFAYSLSSQDARGVYVLVALWWGVAASVTTLVLALRRPAHTVRKMLAAFAGLVLAVLWPLHLAALVTYAVTDRALSRKLRVLDGRDGG
ncbi:hypothetical protein [Streptomyces sp. NPDC021020]|uniref:hypothetical protein n=1 Tax=Streptomyces sp. NPDC021020 TaxID=3365109 RepID=UPI0037AFACD4